jgi:hypothetical protein
MEDVADATAARLDAEIVALRTEHDALDAQLASIQDSHDAAWEEIATFLREGNDPPIEADRAYNSYHAQTMTALATQKTLRERITRLSSPSELERRLQDTAPTVSSTPRAPAEVKLSARDRGVPDVYLGEGGNFRPGMDARYKSDLICAALSLPAPDAKMPFDPADAVARLDERGWTGFLDRKREKIGG